VTLFWDNYLTTVNTSNNTLNSCANDNAYSINSSSLKTDLKAEPPSMIETIIVPKGCKCARDEFNFAELHQEREKKNAPSVFSSDYGYFNSEESMESMQQKKLPGINNLNKAILILRWTNCSTSTTTNGTSSLKQSIFNQFHCSSKVRERCIHFGVKKINGNGDRRSSSSSSSCSSSSSSSITF
jgi:hypothetical protein